MKCHEVLVLILILAVIFTSGCITQKQTQTPENFIYKGTVYTNCHSNPNFPVQTNKQTITISDATDQQQGSAMFPWRAITVRDYVLFDASTGKAIYNFDEMIGKSITATGYVGSGNISEQAFYNKSVILSQNFTKVLYVTEVKYWQNICCDAPSSSNVCTWFPNNYKFEEPECLTDADCAGKTIPKEYQNSQPGCIESTNGSPAYCPQQKWICETGKCQFKAV